MTLKLRKACVTDLPWVYRGEQEYIRRWEPDHEDAWHFQIERHLTRWAENFERLTVATIEGAFAGYALWTPEQGCAELCTINVNPSYRRNGIGQALFEDYALSATRLGFTHLALNVRVDNPAKLMYERAGFVCTGTDARNYLRYERRR